METRDWYAWNNLMSGKPIEIHVIGEIHVGNPGVQAQLFVKEPQGINPYILLLDLFVAPQPGIWPQVMTWVQARYDRIMSSKSQRYIEVEIFHDGASIAKIKVEEVH